MSRRPAIGLGMAGGALGAVGVLSLGHGLAPPLGPAEAIALTFLPPGLVLAAMIGRLAQRRFFDAALIDGSPTTGAAEIDRRVLANTVEQMAPALCVWPGVWPAPAVSLGPRGPGVVTALGRAFAPARIAFWVGYHRSPPARALGFAATFYATVLAALWALRRLAAVPA